MLLGPGDVRTLLAAHGVRPSRALGQNFLADPNTARRIVRLASVGPGDRVLEVGPGVGSLTLALAPCVARVVAVEFDRHLLPVLDDVLLRNAITNVTVVHGDALTLRYADLLGDGEWAMVANLPYNIATPLVATVLDEVPQIARLLVMVQREVGERLAAAPGSDAYGAVSVKVAYHAQARVVGLVPATVFIPRPAVESALVLIERRSAPAVDVADPTLLFSLVRAAFGQRRKTVRQSLRSVTGERTDAILAASGIAPSTRAEQLGLPEWAALAAATAAP